jgi:hypothetical protein
MGEQAAARVGGAFSWMTTRQPFPEPGSIRIEPGVIAICVILLLFLFLLAFSVNNDRSEDHALGVQAGYSDGERVGRVEGFKVGFEAGERNAYNEVLDHAVAEDQFHWNFRLKFRAVALGLIAGFCLQYAIFFILRRIGVLSDVDSMLLPEHSTEGEPDGEQELTSGWLPDDTHPHPRV